MNRRSTPPQELPSTTEAEGVGSLCLFPYKNCTRRHTICVKGTCSCDKGYEVTRDYSCQEKEEKGPLSGTMASFLLVLAVVVLIIVFGLLALLGYKRRQRLREKRMQRELYRRNESAEHVHKLRLDVDELEDNVQDNVKRGLRKTSKKWAKAFADDDEDDEARSKWSLASLAKKMTSRGSSSKDPSKEDMAKWSKAWKQPGLRSSESQASSSSGSASSMGSSSYASARSSEKGSRPASSPVQRMTSPDSTANAASQPSNVSETLVTPNAAQSPPTSTASSVTKQGPASDGAQHPDERQVATFFSKPSVPASPAKPAVALRSILRKPSASHSQHSGSVQFDPSVDSSLNDADSAVDGPQYTPDTSNPPTAHATSRDN